MARKRKPGPGESVAGDGLGGGRLPRPPSLVVQVEQVLRDAIRAGQFAGQRLPTEVELAEQLGVSRETVRRAAEALQAEGLLVKYRRKGTFTRLPPLALDAATPARALLGYLQADYAGAPGRGEGATAAISGLMLQGALAEAAAHGFELAVSAAAPAPGPMAEAFGRLTAGVRLRGIVFASFGEEKWLRRAAGLLPCVLLDHDAPLPGVSSVRDDSFAAAREAVARLARLGHRRIAFVHWHRADLNPWRLRGYRAGLRDAGLPRRRAWEVPAELTAAGARHAADRVLALSPRPTALYCFNNTLARLLHDELTARGLAVPADVSLLGGGGEEVPGLACHQADWHAMGRRGVRLLLQALADPAGHRPEHQLFPHAFHTGRTTAAPGEPPDGRP